MSSKTIAKLLKESDALLKVSEDESPILINILKLLQATLKTVASGGESTKKSKKSDSDADESKPKRKPSAWAAWVRDVKNTHPDEYSEYKTEHPDKKSHVIDFAKAWKDEHTEEYDAFVASYKSDSEGEHDAEEKPKKKADTKPKKAVAEEKPKKKKVVVKKPLGGAGGDVSDSDSDLD
jgi:hypothetical protein